MLEIDVEELKGKLDRGEAVHLVDVREPAEVEICRFDDAELIPMMKLFLGQAPAARREDEIVVFCHVGIRSLEAARYLQARGYPRARSLSGGIDAWAARIDPSLRRY